MSCKLTYNILPGTVNRMCVCYISSIPFNLIEILTTEIKFMTKELVLVFLNQAFLQDYTWTCALRVSYVIFPFVFSLAFYVLF